MVATYVVDVLPWNVAPYDCELNFQYYLTKKQELE